MELTPYQTLIIAIVFRISIPIVIFIGIIYFYKMKGKKQR
jgi:hypothetical protein